MYSARLLRYFYQLDHAGHLPEAAQVMSASVGSMVQGDLIHLSVRLTEGVIRQARFECYGGVVTLAACECFCRWLEGKTLAAALDFNHQWFLAELELSSLHVHTADRLQQLLLKLR